ncbi:hypothetical protein ACHAWF_012868 [Thalassiosira exigua]
MVSSRRVASLLLLAPATTLAAKSSAPATTSSSGNTKPLRFSSPLQSYTIFDKSALSSADCANPRRKFVPRFRAGLAAERRAKDVLNDERRRGIGLESDDDVLDSGSAGGGWAEASAAADERKKKATEERLEAAYDAAVRGYDERSAARTSASPAVGTSAGGGYQFVGVVNDGKVGGEGEGGAVTWYARKKPRDSKWNVRLVHVNRDAVLRDLFVKGKVDVYGKYANKGPDEAAFEAADASGEGVVEGDEQPGMKPRIEGRNKLGMLKRLSRQLMYPGHPSCQRNESSELTSLFRRPMLICCEQCVIVRPSRAPYLLLLFAANSSP